MISCGILKVARTLKCEKAAPPLRQDDSRLVSLEATRKQIAARPYGFNCFEGGTAFLPIARRSLRHSHGGFVMSGKLLAGDARRAVSAAKLLASGNDGEVLAASRALTNLLAKADLNLGSVLAAGLEHHAFVQPRRYLTRPETRRFAERLGVRT